MKNKLMKTGILSMIGGVMITTSVFANTMYTTTDVNFRKTPNGEVLKTLSADEEVYIEEEPIDNWYKVLVDGEEGYIYSNYLDKYLDKKMYVTANNGLNLRTEPNTECEVIKTMPKNTELRILTESIKEDDSWYEGVLEDDSVYYVHKDYLTDIKPVVKKENIKKKSYGSPSVENGKYLGKYKITHYCPNSCCASPNGITASGVKGTPYYTVAMSGLPFGTKLNINGNTYVVQDRGVGSGVIDVMVSNHEEALRKAYYYADVYIQ